MELNLMLNIRLSEDKKNRQKDSSNNKDHSTTGGHLIRAILSDTALPTKWTPGLVDGYSLGL